HLRLLALIEIGDEKVRPPCPPGEFELAVERRRIPDRRELDREAARRLHPALGKPGYLMRKPHPVLKGFVGRLQSVRQADPDGLLAGNTPTTGSDPSRGCDR